MTDNLKKLNQRHKLQREAIDLKSLVSLKRLFRTSWPGRQSLFVAAAVWGLVIAGVTAGLALVIRYLVNDIFVDRNQTAVTGIVAAIIVLSVIKGVAIYFQSTTNAQLRRSLQGAFQRSLFSKLIRYDMSYLGERRAPEHTADLQYFARGSTELVMLLSNSLFRDTATFLALAGVMIAQDIYMSLIVALGAPLFLFFMGKISRRVKRLSIQQVDFNAKLSSRINEALEGIQTVKSFALEEKAERRFFQALNSHEEQALKINRASALLSPLSEILGALVVALLVVFSSIQTLQGNKTPGEYMAFLTAFLFAFEPAKRLARLNVQAQKSLYATKMMFQMLDIPVEGDQGQMAKPLVIDGSGIEFRNVVFAYNSGDQIILRNLSFKINAGEKVAIVGRSGAGKSTIINLLSGFTKVQSGQVLIGGQDISEISDEQIRQQISLVSQDVFLFEGTIRSNIHDGNSSASDADIDDAARKAQVSNFADRLPEGLETQVGPHAGNLSGGQKQRISIARAILKNAPVLVFDEATSALDGESESSIISEAISKAEQSQTVICIAHRKSTIEAADRVLLIDEGELIADGNVADLSRENTLFQALFHVKVEP